MRHGYPMVGMLILVWVAACNLIAVEGLGSDGSGSGESELVYQERLTQIAEIVSLDTYVPTGVIPTPEPKSAEAEFTLELDPLNWYTDSVDTFHFIGMIENIGAIPLENIYVTVSLYDEAGSIVARENSYGERDVLPPGQVTPFHVLFLEGEPDWSSYRVEAEADKTITFPMYYDFALLSVSEAVDDIGNYQISGEFQNTGGQASEFVEIIVALFDEDGNILAAEIRYSDISVVEPGETSTFAVTFFGRVEGEVDSYSMFVEGWIVE